MITSLMKILTLINTVKEIEGERKTPQLNHNTGKK